jgi:serine/threonine protein phosphatase PrpC
MLYGTAQAEGRKSEDRICVLDLGNERRLFAVFDGHSGSETVNELVSGFTQKIKAAIQAEPTQPLPPLLKRLFLEEDKHLAQQRIAKDSGSTATVAIVSPTTITVAYVGDSPGFVFDPVSGQILNQIGKHEPQLVEETQRIQSAGGFVEIDDQGTPRVDGQLMVSRAFGDFSLKFSGQQPPLNADWAKFKVTAYPDVVEWARPSQGVLALLSDGLTETVEGPLKQNETLAREMAIHLRDNSYNLVATTKAVLKSHILKHVPVMNQYKGKDYDDLSLLLVAVGTGAPGPQMSGGRPRPPIPPRAKTKKQKQGRRAFSAKRSRIIRSFTC